MIAPTLAALPGTQPHVHSFTVALDNSGEPIASRHNDLILVCAWPGCTLVTKLSHVRESFRAMLDAGIPLCPALCGPRDFARMDDQDMPVPFRALAKPNIPQCEQADLGLEPIFSVPPAFGLLRDWIANLFGRG